MLARRNGHPLIVALLGLWLLMPAGLLAAPAGEALYRQAVKRYNEAEFEKSIDLLNRALRAGGNPRLLGKVNFQLGITLAVMGEQDKAERAFREALKRDPELSLDAKQVKPEMVELLARVRDGLRGYLSVSADEDVSVKVDGEDVGQAPYEVLVPVGPHEVVVQCGGGARTRRVVVRHGATARFDARCAAAPAADKGGTAPTPGHDGMSRRKRLWTWVVAGTAVAALGVAIGLGASASADYSEFEDLLASGQRDETRREELESSIQSKSMGANVMFGVAGGLAVTSVVLFFLEGRAPTRRRATRSTGPRVQVMIGPVTGLGLRLPF